MIKNKASLIFPVTNTFFWFVVGIELCFRDIANVGIMLVAAFFVFFLDLNLIKPMKKVPHRETMLANVIPSILMSLVVIPCMFLGAEFAGGVFMFLLWLGFFVVLFMTRSHHPRAIYGYAPVRPGGAANNIFRNTGLNDPQGKAANAQTVHGGKTGSDVSNPQSGFNPANGMPMLETGFDMQGNVFGTNSADDFTYNRGFGHTDTPGLGLSDHYSIDISHSHNWHTHDISADTHGCCHGSNDY